MTVTKIASWVLCGLSGIFLLACMVISAGGMIEETKTMFIITLVLVGLSFAFFRIHQTMAEDAASPAAPEESSALLKQALAALEQWEKSDSADDRDAFLQAAVPALFSLGEVKLSPRNKAISAVSDAITVQRALQEKLDEDDDVDEASWQHAEDMTIRAFRLLRDAL